MNLINHGCHLGCRLGCRLGHQLFMPEANFIKGKLQ